MRRSWYYAVVGTPHAQLSCDLGVARSQRPERRRYFLRVLKRCRGDTRTLCIGDLVRYPQGMRGKKHTRKRMWCGKTRVACHLENVPAGHLGNALQSVLDGASTISTTAMPVRPMMLPRHCRRWPIHPGSVHKAAPSLLVFCVPSAKLFNTLSVRRAAALLL
jgi:hypothetical protein